MSRQVSLNPKRQILNKMATANPIHQNLINHYTRLLTRWPIDRLRPEERHFQRLLQSRIATEESPSSPSTTSTSSAAEVNAAYLLLDDTFQKQFRLSDRMMKPASDPQHYQNLAKELEEIPDRSWLGRLVKRVQGMVRFR